MRILIFNWKDISHPHAGGAEVYTGEVARRWVSAGHEVTIFAAAVQGRPSDEVIDGVRFVRAGSRWGVYRAARLFYRAQPSDRYDVVVDEVNTRPFGCTKWVRDTPVVALIHQVCREIWFYEVPWPIAFVGRYIAEPWWLRRYRTVPVLTVSPSSRDSLRAYGLRNVVVVPEGIARKARPDVAKEAQPTVVFVGRLVASKRLDHAIRAVRAARRSIPDLQFWVIGDGPMRRKLENDTSVRFFGRVSRADRDELLARAHALLATSVREGWALVVDEAAAMGTPTIGYACPGLVDSVAAAGGLLVEPSPRALAAALVECLPRWVTHGHTSPQKCGWSGGAVDWDVVAAQCLEAIRSSFAGGTVPEAIGGRA